MKCEPKIREGFEIVAALYEDAVDDARPGRDAESASEDAARVLDACMMEALKDVLQWVLDEDGPDNAFREMIESYVSQN